MSGFWANGFYVGGEFIEDYPVPRCARLDDHDAHGTCPGHVTIEGGALETHDCGNRCHPAEIRECPDGRCEGTLCPACLPCRRVS